MWLASYVAPYLPFLAFMPTFSRHLLGRLLLLGLPVLLLFSSCRSTRYYKERTMLRLTDENGQELSAEGIAQLRTAVNRTAENYLIQPNDYVDVRVYTNKGEKILDPNGELQFGGGPAGGSTPRSTTGKIGATSGASSSGSNTEFLVQADGTVVLPLVNRVRISGLSLLQADSVLKEKYSEFYKEPFVTTRVTNNRVFILGSPGGQVISLVNDNMNLLEVLALAGGVDGGGGGGGGAGLYRYGGKVSNIRIIRGDLKDPQVQLVDLSTLAGMRRANLQMEPNDIVYIEPVRRPFLEALTDAAPVLSATSILLTTTTILITVFR